MTTYVFLGPSLPVEEARSLLGDAVFLPPVQCGDILRLLRLEPDAIGIVDGLFERVAAVWHKEILLALERGVPVVGGGSMGALRAAELHSFSMIGVGRSFQEFRSGVLYDDDEVAVLHTHDFEALSDAMVNIRDTVRAAQRARLLTGAEAAAVIAHAKSCFYGERTFAGSIEAALGAARARTIVEWSRAGGFVDRKRADAIAVLERLKQPCAAPLGVVVPPSLRFRSESRRIACSASDGSPDHLPPPERVAWAARFLGEAYDDARMLAFLLAATHDIATAWAVPEDAAQDAAEDGGDALEGALSDDVAEADRQGYRRRLATVRGLERMLDVRPEHRETSLRDLELMLGGSVSAERTRRLRVLARVWAIFERAAEREGLAPRLDDLQELVDQFRRSRMLVEPAQIAAWLDEHDLSDAELEAFTTRLARYYTLVLPANLRSFGVKPRADTVFWLRDALWSCGLYARAEALARGALGEPPIVPSTDLEAYDRDFAEGKWSARRQLTHLGGMA